MTIAENTGLALRRTSSDGRARAQSMDHLPNVRPNATLITYRSSGRLLVVGPHAAVSEAARHCQAKSGIQCVLLSTEISVHRKEAPANGRHEVYLADFVEITGHLGAFVVEVSRNDKVVNFAETLGYESKTFDLVLDLGDTPAIDSEISPPGYISTAGTRRTIEGAVDEISELVGNFEKPKYFSYDPDICAHGRSGLIGCSRCLDACPTDAISSIGEMIEVDPYLCQGAGACSSACPTGAITYDHPCSSTLIDAIRNLLKSYRQAGGENPSVLFYDSEAGSEIVVKSAASLPQNLLPIEVEEIGSIGIDIWLTCIAYGSRSVSILVPPPVARSVTEELRSQIEYFDALLVGAGYENGAVRLLEADGKTKLLKALKQGGSELAIEPANFLPSGAKRTDIRMALDYLYELAQPRSTVAALPEGAPFGEIKVDRGDCTLCFACVSVCPASALEAGGDTPKLSFIEWNCVQCGLCETACPETAISLKPRFVFDPAKRMRSRTLNEDAPLCCIGCGKPFATRSMLARMQTKLKDHWMFQDPDAVKRLEMCEDCRVKDMYENDNSQIKF